jgi:L-rhamnose mutarotase
MLRKAFVMTLKPGCEAEYEKRHNPIWPELEEVLKEHGATNYSIFLHRDTLQLFGYAEIESEARWLAIAQTPICRRWWAYMKELMLTNPDDSPAAIDLKEVFHIEKGKS